MYRANHLITEENDKIKEINDIKKVLKANQYKPWMLKIPEKKKSTPTTNNQDTVQNNNLPTRKPKAVYIPYIKGVSEKLQVIHKKLQNFYNPQTLQHH